MKIDEAKRKISKGCIASEVINYILKHPDQVFTPQELCIKFGEGAAIPSSLLRAYRKGTVERYKVSSSLVFYGVRSAIEKLRRVA